MCCKMQSEKAVIPKIHQALETTSSSAADCLPPSKSLASSIIICATWTAQPVSLLPADVQNGQIERALHIYALVLDDTRRAQALCQRVGSKETHLLLLKMLLHPPDGRSAKYIEACRVLASPGEALLDRRTTSSAAEALSHLLESALRQLTPQRA